MKKTIILIAVGLFGTEIAWEIWKFYMNRRKSITEINGKKKLIAEVLQFSEYSRLCRDHANTRIPCEKLACPVANVRRIATYLSSASSTLDVCMYVMTCDDLTKAIIATHRRGVIVRLIVDSGMSEHPACNDQVLRMRRAGVEVRMNRLQTTSLMHHKFAIVDQDLILIGSTNWTMQAFYGNYDGIIITNVQECVKPYLTQFDKMWLDFAE